jgi:hypothetical protein
VSARRASAALVAAGLGACTLSNYAFEGRVTDAGRDAGTDVSGDAPPRFCSTQTAAFCRDFDDTTAMSLGWDAVTIRGNGTAVFDTMTAATPVMRATLPGQAGPSDASETAATVGALVSVFPPDVELTFQMLWTANPFTGESGQLTVATISPGGARDFVAFGLQSAAFGVAVLAGPTAQPRYYPVPTNAVPFGRWNTVRLAVTFGDATHPGRVQLSVNGELRVDQTVAAIGVAARPTRFALALGLTANGATPASTVAIDDVLLNYTR